MPTYFFGTQSPNWIPEAVDLGSKNVSWFISWLFFCLEKTKSTKPYYKYSCKALIKCLDTTTVLFKPWFWFSKLSKYHQFKLISIDPLIWFEKMKRFFPLQVNGSRIFLSGQIEVININLTWQNGQGDNLVSGYTACWSEHSWESS